MIKENSKPILFNTEMVKSILDGRKTQTRRVIKIKNKLTRDWAESTGVQWIKEQNENKYKYAIREQNGGWAEYSLEKFIKEYSKYKVNDILYVKETFRITALRNTDKRITVLFKTGQQLKLSKQEHRKDFKYFDNRIGEGWKPSIHMPIEYARIFLKVTNVRVERLQDLSVKDIIGEGCPQKYWNSKNGTKEAFVNWWISLWNSTAKNGYKWEDNPYVFVYEFERVC